MKHPAVWEAANPNSQLMTSIKACVHIFLIDLLREEYAFAIVAGSRLHVWCIFASLRSSVGCINRVIDGCPRRSIFNVYNSFS